MANEFFDWNFLRVLLVFLLAQVPVRRVSSQTRSALDVPPVLVIKRYVFSTACLSFLLNQLLQFSILPEIEVICLLQNWYKVSVEFFIISEWEYIDRAVSFVEWHVGNLRHKVLEEGLKSDFHLVIIEVLGDLISQEILKWSEFGLDPVLNLALIDFFSIQNLLLLLDEDAAALIEEAFIPIHQELTDELEEDVFVVPKVLGKHFFQNPLNHCHMIGVIFEFMGGVSHNQIDLNLKGSNHERGSDIWLQISLGVSIA